MPRQSLASFVEQVSETLGVPVVETRWPDGIIHLGRGVPLSEVSGTSEPDYVMHTYDMDEVVDERAASGQASPLGSPQRGMKIGEKFVTVRRFAALYKDLAKSSVTVPPNDAYRYVLDVLDDLRIRHENSTVHGDVRPDNVEVRGSAAYLIDAGTRVRYQDLDEFSRLYVAPEHRNESSSRGSAPGDIYSFLRLAQALLRPHMGRPDVAALETQWSWMVDAASVAEPSERPSANDLLEVFPRDQIAPIPRLGNRFLDGFNAAKAQLDTHPLTWLGETAHLTNDVVLEIKKVIDLHPETVIFLSEESARRILTWRAIDLGANSIDTRINDQFNGKQEFESLSRELFNQGIDDRWMNQIHVDFYGKGIGPDHEDNLVSVHERAVEQRNYDDKYYEYLGLACKVRETLLSEHAFMHTADVVSHFGSIGVELAPLDIVVLRRWGYLLAVPDHDRWLYPTFQFSPTTGFPSSLIMEVNEVRRRDRDSDVDEWATLSFWGEPAVALDGRPPRTLIWDDESHARLRKYIKDYA